MAKRATPFCVCALLVCLALAASAEEAQDVETIEVRAERSEETPIFLDTPVETEEIPAERLQALPAQDLADVAANLPGVRVQRRVQGQAAAASVEGLPPEYTKVLVNRQHYAGELGGVTDLEDLPLANASRVLVLRGPQGVRYGSDTGGAVIALETMRPPADDGFGFVLDGGGGGDGQIYGSQVSAARFGRLGATLATTYSGIDGWDARGSDAVVTAPGSDSRESAQDGYGTLEYALSEDVLLRSNLGWRKDEDEAEGDGRRTTSRWISSAGVAAALGDDTDVDAELFRFASDLDSSIGRDFRLRDEQWKLDAGATRRFSVWGREPSFRVGLDWRVPSLELNESEVQAGDGEVRESLTETGLYAIAEAPLSDWATLELGGRQQWNSRFDPQLVPQVALLLQPVAWLRLRGSWGASYRTPSLRDLYEPPVPNLGGAYFLSGNPNLEPEDAVGLRGGFELEPTENLWLSATFFTNRIDDFIRSRRAPGGIVVGSHWVDPSEGSELCQIIPDDPACQPYLVEDRRELFVKSNLDHVRTSGVEANVRWRPHPNVDLRAGYTFLDTWVKSELLPDLHELPNEPRYTVDLDATLTAPRVDTALTLRARWRDGALTESSGTGLASFSSLDRSDPSWLLDLRLRQPLRSGLWVYLDLRNLLNTKAVDSYEVRGFTAFAGIRLER